MEEVEYAEVSLPADSFDRLPTEAIAVITEKINANKKLTKKEIEVLKKSNQFSIKTDLGEGKIEDESQIRARNVRFTKYTF